MAILLTVLAPALRTLPGGTFIPDPWLLLLLWAVPEPPPWSWRGPIKLVLLLGVLRASVSAVSPFPGWAGLAMAVALRHLLHRRVVDRHLYSRFAVGAVAAMPLALFDLRAALELGLPLRAVGGSDSSGIRGIALVDCIETGPLSG